MGFDVVGIGDLCLDITAATPRIPATDMASELLYTASQGGGKVPTALVALSRLGASCTLFCTYGGDAAGAFCRQELQDAGVDTGNMVCVPEETTNLTICLAERETQGRSFLGKAGTPGEMTPEEVDEELIESARVIHLSCASCRAQGIAVEFAKKHHVEISLDAGAFFPGAKELAEQSDILIMSEQFYEGMFGEDTDYCGNCKKLVEQGAKIAIVTLGKKGCAGADARGTFELPAYSGAGTIVDTTGAGDVFHGGFLYAYLYRYGREPWNYDLKDCAAFASAVSYINCTTLGGRPGIPTLEMVDTFLRDGVIPEGDIPERRVMDRNGVFV